MNRILPALALAAVTLANGSAAAVVWTCEVRHGYDVGPDGTLQRSAPSAALGNSLTVNDETGEVTGRLIGQPQEWKAVPRRFGADQDGLQVLRTTAGRPNMHLYVETFATGAAKPFVLSDLSVGASRTGACRAGR